ncbi:RNA polymerase-binding protein RbpA [Microlunatus aurantiacus]|uniref:RNA polymerase-binding protein RbpA n=1 Tax=Microlunatus aurantiacus TaxID=446786 RepID=A0ABP7EKD4_9ACTN
MRSHTMNATGLGSKSFENDRDVTLSPRLEIGFDCPAPHHFSVTFAVEASLPLSWDCPTCWAPGVRTDGARATAQPAKPTRTHWDMLRERRSLAELEAILAERLALMKAGVIGPGIYESIPPRKRKAA